MSQIIQSLQLAIDGLTKNQIVAIPTETVYGLAGNAESEAAIEQIYTLKNRPRTHPLIMHVSETCDISRWVEPIPDYARRLMEKFWPGPLTLVLPTLTNAVSHSLTGGQNTVAIRCPAHPLTSQLLATIDFPLVAPSANPFGKISPTTAEHVKASFPDASLLILDGGRCSVGIESTILDATDANSYRILRQGSLSEKQIADFLDMPVTHHASAIRTPGQLAQHYQPQKPLYCFNQLEDLQAFVSKTTQSIYVLSFEKENHFPNQVGYELPFDPEQLSYELYYQLRAADTTTAGLILFQLPPDESRWAAVRERLMKAGRFF